MICVTGLEKQTCDLLSRLEACSAFGLQEVRLDALEDELPSAAALPVPPGNLLITCRRTSDGGLFKGPENERFLRLEKALQLKPGWIDLEADITDEKEKLLIERARVFGVRTLRSLHQFETAEAGTILKALARLSGIAGDGIKLAVSVDDMIRLDEFFTAPRARPAVLIGMGPAGVLSRALYRRFHSAWTYISAEPWPDREAWIPDLSDAWLWNMPVNDTARLLVLLGGPSIVHSPGPPVYNRLFREREANALYLPAITECLEPAFSLLSRLKFSGASVTIPHKIQALNLADDLEKEVRLCGSLNTLHQVPDGRWRGANTDITAVRSLTQRLAPRPFLRGVVMGTGGLARACAFALTSKGIAVALVGRKVLLDDGPWIKSWPISELSGMEFDILINATPVGLDPSDDPLLPEEVSLKDKVVIDAVLSRSPTPLVTRARSEGAHVADGMQFWCEQGAEQMRRFNEPPVTPQRLAELAKSANG
ncbi:MAG: type I 3-dehydroquinate dehydratase [Planctomycetota bacterium]